MTIRCVVVDDHPALVQAISDFLSGNDVDVVGTAADGERAVTLVDQLRPDVALVDFRMPRLAGIELLTRLRTISPETRLIVYTADADEALVRGALGAGASGILLKEAPLVDLSRALSTVADGGTYLDPALAQYAVGVESGKPVLTDRERSVLELLTEGLSNDQIGARLQISGETVRTHVRKACVRLGAATRTEAVAKALRLGLIS